MKKFGILLLSLSFMFIAISCSDENDKNNPTAGENNNTELSNELKPIVPSILGSQEYEVLLCKSHTNVTNKLDQLIIGDSVNSYANININSASPKERYNVINFDWQAVNGWNIPESGLPVILSGEPIKREGIDYDYYTSEKAKKSGYIVRLEKQMQADSTFKTVEIKVPVKTLIIEYDFNLTSIRKK